MKNYTWLYLAENKLSKIVFVVIFVFLAKLSELVGYASPAQ